MLSEEISPREVEVRQVAARTFMPETRREVLQAEG